MKKIICELCDSTDFVKDNGLFICQGCSTKYNAAEVKAMMVECDDVEIITNIDSTESTTNNQQLQNLLILAASSYDAENYKEAENYCNKVIELDSTSYSAWILKGRAVGWQSSIDNIRIEEAAHAFGIGINNSPENERQDLIDSVTQELQSLGIALISVRKNRFAESPTDQELKGFANDRIVLLNALATLVKYGNMVSLPDEEYRETIARLMNDSAVSALNMARNAWNNVDHPSDNDLKTYLDWIYNIEELLRQAVKVNDAVTQGDIQTYKNLAIVLKEPIDKHSVKYEFSYWAHDYKWMKSMYLNDDAVASRNREIQRCHNKIAEIKQTLNKQDEEKRLTAEREKKQRITAYWDEHENEKNELDTKKTLLINERATLKAKINNLTKKIDGIIAEEKELLPFEIEREDVKNRIGKLNEQKKSLGLFASKEKKRIAGDILALESKLIELKPKVAQEKLLKSETRATKEKPLKVEMDTYQQKLKEIDKSLADIEIEFTKDR